MSTSPFSIIAGPASVYIAPVATAFPDINTTPGASWTYLGFTDGGVKVKHSQKVELLMADQDTAPIKAIRSEEGLEVSFDLAQLTLENYRYAMNNATVTTGSGPAVKRIDLYLGGDVAQHALLVRGYSAYAAFSSQYQVPIVVQTEEPEVDFTRTDKSVLKCVFTAIALLDGDPKFGRLVMQTA